MPKEKVVDLSIITPVHDKELYLKGFIKSIIDQDIWERMELICVENGSTDKSWEELNKIVSKLPKKDQARITLLQIDKANACIARNEGAKLAKGRYWSFLPSDASLFPGTARTWVESLDEFPEYGFLYGGYRFAPPHGGVYMSEAYDFDMIKQYNYIDGSFPFKKELFPWWNNGGWDPEIKSLQDWDFFLAIIMGEEHKGSGVKGLYRPEVFFETIPPQPGGLSEDSHANWIERTKQIKDKFGIKEGEICVTSPGASFHAKNVAKLLGEDFRWQPQSKASNFKMIYEIGFYPQLQEQCSQVFTTVDGKIFPGKKVIHWVGSDIWGLLNSSYLNVGKLRELFDFHGFIHLCEFEQTQAELKDLGIKAEIVPLPPLKMYDLMPLPKKFTVAVYMPQSNAEFYYKELMEEVALALPDIQFYFFGDRFNLNKKKNIQYVGYIDDMTKFISECSGILRLTVHDGLPISLVEFVMAGRNALFNIKLPHMMYVNSGNKDLIVQRIRDMQKLPLNESGSKYYREMMDHDKYSKSIHDLLTVNSYNPNTYWEGRAKDWDHQADHGVFPHVKEVEEMLSGLEYSSVLDVGCGNGRWSQFFTGKNYSGIDISSNLISLAKQYYPERDFKSIKLEDIQTTPKGKFDLAFVYTCLQHIKPEDIELAASKLKDVSRFSLLIESPEGWDGSYGFNHDYSKYFNIIKTMQAETTGDNSKGTLRLMLVQND